MRVLMTTDAVGGVWTYATQLARGLRLRGVRVTLATMGPAPTPEQRREAASIGIDLHVGDFKLEWTQDPWADVERAGAWLLDLSQRMHPDVVHLNGYCHAALDWQAPTVVVAHSCVCSWWRAVKGKPAPASWDRYRHAVERGLRAAGCVVAPTRAMLEFLRSEYRFNSPSQVIFNGGGDSPAVKGEKLPIVFSAGRVWDEAKNIAALDAAAARVLWPVYVAGEDRPGASTGGARRLGRLAAPDLAEWMGRASIYASPARYEPFGLSILEAASAGCALVLGDIPTLGELWDGAAEFVDPGDSLALADCINSLIRNQPRRERLAERARDRARRYTADRMTAAYHALYGRLTDGRSADHRQAPLAVEESVA